MDLDSTNAERERLNKLMAEREVFFEEFAGFEGEVYSDRAIPKLYKELMGLLISVFARCEDCVAYHILGALDAGATSAHLIEAVRVGVDRRRVRQVSNCSLPVPCHGGPRCS